MDGETRDAVAWLVEQMNERCEWRPVQVELLRSRITAEDYRDVKRGGGLPLKAGPGSFRVTPLPRPEASDV